MNDLELVKKAMKNAYDPYTNYKVGAVLSTKSGKKFMGCNIANHGIQSICAERVAFAKAISEGETEFEKIEIVGKKADGQMEECLPCGYCRQFMSEFVDSNFKICTLNEKQYSISELLPFEFEI